MPDTPNKLQLLKRAVAVMTIRTAVYQTRPCNGVRGHFIAHKQ